MPGFDRTGPQGRGSMTGRRMGNCSGNANEEGFVYGRGGRGFGRGFGRGAGFGNKYGFGGNQQQFLTNVTEKTILENDINTLKDQLSSLEKQLNELKQDE